MGNEFCLSKRSPKRTILNDEERQQVKRLYKKLISRHDEQVINLIIELTRMTI
ncbi:unnamed protein product [Paramecium octaurelia]|uniref:Uncharacterized protein n=1 Tax=Paramecium octaurelia TaxID=43137 RepID=A0A8S1VTW3_PAROT|nr:unnamed protein product [Paramecium octaurelia]